MGWSDEPEMVEVTAIYLGTTERAMKIAPKNRRDEIWLPYSQTDVTADKAENELEEGDEITFGCAEWLADKEFL